MDTTRLFNFRCEEETLNLIDECAKLQKLDKTKIIKTAIRGYLAWFYAEGGMDRFIKQKEAINKMNEPLEPIYF